MVSATLTGVVPVRNVLGEGILWDELRQRALWTDILGSKLYHYDLASQTWKSEMLPARLCSFGLTTEPGHLISAFADSLALYDIASNRAERFFSCPDSAANIRFNDGRVDRQGRFWVGSMVEDYERSKNRMGQVFRVDQDLTVTSHIEQIAISNSLCWSPDSTKMYFSDTFEQQIQEYEFDQQFGTIFNPKVFAKSDKNAFPDGSDVDAEGYVWNAQWGASKVVRYAPDGTVDFELNLPITQPTCVAFGGPQLDILFVTSASQGLEQADSYSKVSNGDVLIYQTDCKGLVSPRFSIGHV